MATIHCTNPDCAEVDVPKTVTDDLADAARAGAVMCGACNDLIPGDTYSADDD